ncbi:MAG TPA: hypothetical protein VFH89_05665 [Sphingomicrobium sp.]|nr:hypothetical protein [Sphingomicrobium sp.]
MKALARLGLIPPVLLTLGATPAATYIPVGKYNEAIVMPAGTPLKLDRIEFDDRALFSGRLVIEGTWVLDCDYCEPGQKDNELRLSMVPDTATIARLPRWKRHDNDIRIDLADADRFIRSVSTVDERKRLHAGTLLEIRGHAAIMVDHYEATLECDAASYSARFVDVAQVAKRANLPTDGNYGCGYAETSSAVARPAGRS